MVLFKQRFLKDKKFYLVTTSSYFLQLDFPSILYGKSFKIPSVDNPPKQVKFILPILPKIIDGLFLSQPSLSVLVPNDSIHKIYCTKPVYEQIILKYKECESQSVTYEDVQEEIQDSAIYSFENFNIEQFKTKVEIILLGQNIWLNSIRIT